MNNEYDSCVNIQTESESFKPNKSSFRRKVSQPQTDRTKKVQLNKPKITNSSTTTKRSEFTVKAKQTSARIESSAKGVVVSGKAPKKVK